ncbi:MAG TPA: nitroreductase [Candidatus Binatia bacterium]
MDVIEAIRGRRSTRAFLPDPVGEDELRSILEVARWAPSGGNCQPWHIYALCGGSMQRFREAVAEAAREAPLGEPTEFPMYPPQIKEPYRSRRFECGEALYRSIGIPREDKPSRIGQLAKNFDFFGAPAAFFFAIDRQMGPGQWAHLGMLMQTIALVAESRGLASCMQESWMQRHSLVRRFFEVPDHWQLYCGMAIGYRDDAAAINSWRTERAHVDEFASFRS